MRRLAILAITASFALITACGGDDDEGTTAVPEAGSSSETTEEAVPVVGGRWVLNELETADASVQAAENTEAYFQIDENGEVTGSTGCNGFGGSAEVGDGTITFQPLIATKKACAAELGQIDSGMLSVLRGEVTTEIDGDVLTITNPEGGSLTLRASDEPASDL